MLPRANMIAASSFAAASFEAASSELVSLADGAVFPTAVSFEAAFPKAAGSCLGCHTAPREGAPLEAASFELAAVKSPSTQLVSDGCHFGGCPVRAVSFGAASSSPPSLSFKASLARGCLVRGCGCLVEATPLARLLEAASMLRCSNLPCLRSISSTATSELVSLQAASLRAISVGPASVQFA
jgi:hypothetical protein